MAELSTESDAESLLLGAILGPDTDDLDGQPSEQVRDAAADVDGDDETQGDGEDRGEAEHQQKKQEAKQAAEEDDYVEIAGEDGKEPTRYKVADLLKSHQELQQFNGQREQILDRVEREAVGHATQQLRQVEQYSRNAALTVHAHMQLIQPPQPPNTDMLNPASQNYNPDQYHMAFANYQRASQLYGQAQEQGKQLIKQADEAADHARGQREQAALTRLDRAWPEFRDDATRTKFVSDMTKEYGYSPEELDMALGEDHRNALVARDALAFRAMKAQSGDVKAKVEAKAPKIVRSNSEGKSSAQRNDKGQFTNGALANLRKTGSDDAAAAYFTGLIKSGRI